MQSPPIPQQAANQSAQLYQATASPPNEFRGNSVRTNVYPLPKISEIVKQFPFDATLIYGKPPQPQGWRVADKDGFGFSNERRTIFNIEFVEFGVNRRGKNILMVHGVPTNMRHLYALAEKLSPFAHVCVVSLLGMGWSTAPDFGEVNGDGVTGTELWKWKYDAGYLHMLAGEIFGRGACFIAFGADWGAGPITWMAGSARMGTKLANGQTLDSLAHVEGTILEAPIAGWGYPVPDIEQFGPLSLFQFDDNVAVNKSRTLPETGTFQDKASGLKNIFTLTLKRMAKQSDDLFNQWSMRTLLDPYYETDYERPANHRPSQSNKPPGAATSLSLRPRYAHIYVMSQRAAVLGPQTLLPYAPGPNPEGFVYDTIAEDMLVYFGKQDDMMPENQRHTFVNVIQAPGGFPGPRPSVDTAAIYDAGHFVSTDALDQSAELILGWIRARFGLAALGGVVFFGYTGVWKGNENVQQGAFRRIISAMS